MVKNGHKSKGLWIFSKEKRYYQARELRQQKMTFKEIGKVMGITGSRAAVLSNFVDFKIKYQKQRRISNELKEIIKKAVPKTGEV